MICWFVKSIRYAMLFAWYGYAIPLLLIAELFCPNICIVSLSCRLVTLDFSTRWYLIKAVFSKALPIK